PLPRSTRGTGGVPVRAGRQYSRRMRGKWLVAMVALVLAACGQDDAAPDTSPVASPPDDACAHVVDGEIERDGDGTFTVSATVSSADTGPEKYADAWEIRDEEGEVLDVRELLHPHVDEQPFTRSLNGVEIPDHVDSVTLAAHDSVEGFCGETLRLDVP
ncbi:MAG: hypothetical protein ACLFWM_13510, partial [Actinomycetota bacterium]